MAPGTCWDGGGVRELREPAGNGGAVDRHGVVAYREYREGRFGPALFARFAVAFVLTFSLGSKVLSPECVIWLLPLVPPPGAGGVWGLGVSTVFLAVCGMTPLVNPYHYLEVLQGRFPGIDVLLGRDLLLVVLWGFMLSLPSESEPASETMQKTAAGQGGT